MQVVWTSHLRTPQEKESFKQLLLNQPRQINDRFETILTNALTRMQDEQLKLTQYDNPNWPCYQAHLNGYAQAINMVLDLIDYEDKR